MIVSLWTMLLCTEHAASAATSAGTAIGTSSPFGLGIVLGDPTGLSAKLYLGGGRKNAIDFALAYDEWTWHGTHAGRVHFHADYLWHPSVLAQGTVIVPWHVGIGGFIETWQGDFTDGNASLGVRVPLGIDVDLRSFPVQFFADIALDAGVLFDTGVWLDFGVGARYYF